jgi:hypothetical protein
MSTIFTFIHSFLMPTPSYWYPIPPVHHFFKCMLTVQGVSPGTLGLYILCFIQINTSITYSFSVSSLQCIVLYYINIQIGSINVFHSLTFCFPLTPPIVPWVRSTNIIVLSHYLCVYVYIHMIIYVFMNRFNLLV